MKRYFLGWSLVILSVCIFSFNAFKLTGGVIGVFSESLNLIAFVFLIVGLTISLREPREGNLASEILRSGAVITDPKKIKKIAGKIGYYGREVKEGYQILDESGKPLTVIPRHHISQGVYRNIMKSLSTGESSFRKYQSA